MTIIFEKKKKKTKVIFLYIDIYAVYGGAEDSLLKKFDYGQKRFGLRVGV